MYNGWQPKLGDKIFRPRRIKRYRLRRILGVPALFSAGYGNVGSSIYYALGIIALAAMGATPVVLGIAGVLFIFTALTYAEAPLCCLKRVAQLVLLDTVLMTRLASLLAGH